MKFRFIESDTYEIIAYGKEKNELFNIIETMCLTDNINIIGLAQKTKIIETHIDK